MAEKKTVDTTFTQGTPYWDDYSQNANSAKNYLRILFQPGRSVQVRELNQMQSAIQDQIAKFGNHIFKDGARVLDGEIDIDNKTQWVDINLKADAISWASDTSRPLIGKKIYAGTSPKVFDTADVAATISDYELISDSKYRFYVRYASQATDFAGGGRIQTSILLGETISSSGLPTINSGVTIGDGSGAIETGYALKMHNAKGIYYAKGYFVEAPEQTKYVKTNASGPQETITGSVGFTITESNVTAVNDSTLYDNADGSSNFSAPGADRYTMSLTLTLITDDTDLDTTKTTATSALNVIDVLSLGTAIVDDPETKVVSQSLQPITQVDQKYNELGDVFAKRTFEESGDYALQPFQLDLREDKDNGFNRGRADDGDEAKFIATLEPSTAYIKGKRIDIQAKQSLTQNKARVVTDKSENLRIQAQFGSYIEVDNITFLPKIDNTEEYTIRDDASGHDQGNAVATCKIRGIEFTGKKYRLYIHTITMSGTTLAIDAGRAIYGDSASAENDASNRFVGTLNASSQGTILNNVGETNSLFLLPMEYVKTLTPAGVTSTTIKLPTRDKVQNEATDSATQVAFTIGTGELYHENPNEYIVTREDTGAVIPVSAVALSTVSSTLDTATLTLVNSPAHGASAVDITFSKRITGTAGSKTRNASGTKTVSGATTYALGDEIDLGQTDIISITSINSAADGSGTDLSDSFVLDDGQSIEAYSNGKLICNAALASTQVHVTFVFLEHTTPGSFFSVDSYPLADTSGGAMHRSELAFISGVCLSDVLDFRHNSHVDLDPNGIIEIGGVEIYLPRHDRIVLNSAGEFLYLEGDALAGAPRPVPEDSMLLYNLGLPAFTNSVADIDVGYEDNRRYTMRDIGKLAKRVKSLEYYTSLSLLEKITQDKQIFDNGGDRFKNGIIVDEFKGHDTADVSDPGYAVSMEPETGIMRPAFSSQNLSIRNNAMNASSGANTPDVTYTPPVGAPGAGVATPHIGEEDLVRLPITSVNTLINQDKASIAISVNPFDVASWVGEIKLSPSSDEWRDTKRRPEVIIKNDASAQATLRMMNETLASQGTRWNDWNTTWSGNVEVTDLGWNTIGQLKQMPASQMRQTTFRRRRRWWRRRRVTRFDVPTFNGGTVSTTNTRRARVHMEQRTESGKMIREGVQQFAEFGKAIEQDMGDKIVDVTFVPFIRSRKVYFHATGFKPKTTLYPFFDGVDVSGFTVADASYSPTEYRNDTVRTDHTGNTASDISSVQPVTDSAGRVSGYFVIPQNTRLRFRTGEREFRLIDNSSNDLTTAGTYGTTMYTARGIIQTLQKQILSTRTVKVSQRTVKEERNISRSQTAATAIRHVDPLAQTFVVDVDKYPQGVFLKDVDLFFKKKHGSLPVRIQIVTCENGIPTQDVIPFSEVEKQSADVSVSDTAASATTFTFESLVHLKGGVEYAIVVLSNSPEYFLWHSEVGGTDVATNKRIIKNPYTGVALKSQNASTWTPDQNKDFKFHMRYARFSESELGTTTYSRTIGNSSTNTNYGDFITIKPVDITSSAQLKIDSINLLAEEILPPGTSINYFITVKEQDNTTTTYDVQPGSVLELDKTLLFDDVTQLKLHCVLITDNPYMTPILDTNRLSFLTFANLINGGTALSGETGANHGTATSRYVTNFVRLDNAASRLDAYLDINRPAPEANVEVYARFSRGGTFIKLDSEDIPVTGGFSEVHFRTPDASVAEEINFELFQVKIVLSTHLGGSPATADSATVPRCMNFRAIATS